MIHTMLIMQGDGKHDDVAWMVQSRNCWFSAAWPLRGIASPGAPRTSCKWPGHKHPLPTHGSPSLEGKHCWQKDKSSVWSHLGAGGRGRWDGTVYFSLLQGRKSARGEMDFDGGFFACLVETSRCTRFWLSVWKNKIKQNKHTKPKQTTKPPRVPVLPQSPEVRKQ